MQTIKVWDPLVRLFHWSLVIGFTLDAVILDEDSRLHEQVGYVVLGLIGARLVWGLVGTKYARFSSFKPLPPASIEQLGDIANQRTKPHVGHSPLGALMIYNLLTSIALIGLTGWMMTATEQDVAGFTLKGYSISEEAELRGSREGTIKAQLNAIYRKADVENRGQLVSLLIEDLMRAPLVERETAV